MVGGVNITSGAKMTRNRKAAKVSGDGLASEDCALDACDRISGTATKLPSAVDLVIAITQLVRGGIASRTACGRMM